MMLMGRRLEELCEWRQLQPREYLAPVASMPGTNYRWLYESLNGGLRSGGVLVETDGFCIRRPQNGRV